MYKIQLLFHLYLDFILINITYEYTNTWAVSNENFFFPLYKKNLWVIGLKISSICTDKSFVDIS